MAQTVPYMFIVQHQFGDSVAVVPPISSQVTIGSSDIPARVDWGSQFTIYVDAAKNAYSGETLFFYMQDFKTGSGAINGGSYQTTALNVPGMRLTQIPHPTNPATLDRYTLTIPEGSYPTLMNSGNSWNSAKDGTIFRPSVYVGHTPNVNAQAAWSSSFVVNADVWGVKNLRKIWFPETNNNAVIEINQYDAINRDLETMLLAGVPQPGGGTFTLPSTGNSNTYYTWYMRDQYGVSPYVSTVNNTNNWLNNVYQGGYKPWINSIHVDTTNHIYMSKNSKNESCYTLYYYVIPTSRVSSGYADTATFRQYASRIAVKIKPVNTPPLISSPVTIAKQDYGSATAGTQWGPQRPSGETNYTYSTGYLPGDGAYAITQDIKGTFGFWQAYQRPPDWYVPASGNVNDPAKKYDHTSGNGTGFMYMVNADASGGVFYKNTFTVCPNMNLQFSMWLMNMCDGTRSSGSSYSAYRVKPNVRIQIWPNNITNQTPPTSGTPLLDYYTGEIPMTGIWEQYFTPVFNVGSTPTVTVFYLSVPAGGTGNDFLMDDIQIQRSNGAVRFSSADFTGCLSATDSFKIKAALDTTALKQNYGTIPDILYYQWTYYSKVTNPDTITTGGTAITFASGTTPVSGSVIYSQTDTISLIVPPTQVGTYRLTIANSSAGLTVQCAAYSYYVFVPPAPPTIEATPATGPVCPGSPINFQINTSNIPDPSQLKWFTIGADSVTLKPLLDSSGNQVSGANINVTPFSTTTYAVQASGCTNSLNYTVIVAPGPKITFGSGTNQTDTNYVYRVSYDVTSPILIPVTWKQGTVPMNYEVHQDEVANASVLYSGQLTATSGAGSAGTISINPNSIKPSLSNFINGLDTVTCVVLVKDGSTNACASVQRFKIHFIAGQTPGISVVWAPGRNKTSPNDNTNWNNDANWYIADSLGNRYGRAGIPTDSSHVIIPGDATAYPVLQPAAAYAGQPNVPTDDEFNPQPRCKSITFQFGGEVAKLQYLDYLYAFVEMNLGTYGDNGFVNTANTIDTDSGSYYPNYISRDRYYSMSAPLKDMYSGDFAFGGRPSAYMKYADEIYINSVRLDANAELVNKWTKSINSYDIAFKAGFGFGYDVVSGDLSENWPYANNQKNLNNVSGIVRWPYFMNSAYRDSINPLHTYTEISGTTGVMGQSTFTYYESGKPENLLPDKTDQVTRRSTQITLNEIPTTVPLGNRFILEDSLTNRIQGSAKIPIGTPQTNDNNEILVGNPFMSHLDFQQFYLKNIGKIRPYCRIWLGTAQYYTVKVDTISGVLVTTTVADNDTITVAGNEIFIPPMQSFFVPVLSGDSITFDTIMSVAKPNKWVILRSPGATDVNEILKITAANSRYSATAVVIHKPGEKELSEGVPKLFSSSGNIPDIYLIQGYKKEILEIDETPQAIPLGIKTQVTGGVLRLTFTGLENFSTKVALKDTKTGETRTLTAANNVYSFLNSEGDQINRFFLLFGNYTGINNPAANWISVSARDSRIYVNASSLDPVQSVKIYNLQG